MCVDPAFTATGVAVYSLDKGVWSLVDAGLIETEKSDAKKGMRVADDTVLRVQHIFRSLLKVASDYDVRALACELPPGGGKSASAIKALSIATAVQACLVEVLKLPADWVSPDDVKKALAGTKAAGKPAMMLAALALHPELAAIWAAKGKPLGRFEHVADAIGVFQTVRTGSMIRMLEKN